MVVLRPDRWYGINLQRRISFKEAVLPADCFKSNDLRFSRSKYNLAANYLKTSKYPFH